MLTLKLNSNSNKNINPFIESSFDNNSSYTMPRAYSNSSTPTPTIGRKRKADNNSNNNDSLITPPSSKKFKSAPTSPTAGLYSLGSSIYETPKTPSPVNLAKDYLIEDNNKSPNYLTTSSNLSSHDVTPPHSANVSPRLSTFPIVISKPINNLNNLNYKNGNMYLYPDTCYPFNISGNPTSISKPNVRLNNWRNACNDKIRHEHHSYLKDLNKINESIERNSNKTLNQIKLNVPSINNNKLFPNFNQINNYVKQGVNYPHVNTVKEVDYKAEAKLLLSIKNNNNHVQAYPLKAVKSDDKYQLPSIKQIIKLTPFDKSTIHPNGLTSQEIEEFKNSENVGILLNKNSNEFYNGNKIKYGNAIIEHQNKIFNNHYNQKYYNYNSSSLMNYNLQYGLYSNHKLILPNLSYSQQQPQQLPHPPSHSHTNCELKSPINFSNTRLHSNKAFMDLNKEVSELISSSDDELRDIKKYQTKFSSNPLKVSKTRKKCSTSSVSKVTKREKSSSKSSSNASSRSSSRKSSSNKTKSISNQNIEYQYNTRSKGRSSSENSNVSLAPVETAELTATASIESTPKNGNNMNNEILVGYSGFENGMNISIRDELVNNYPSQPVHTHLQQQERQQPTNTKHKTHTLHSHPTKFKKCISCKSTTAPCWRPSWSPEAGQLCNSCGLRYRKIKARCLNPDCLVVPTKSDWSSILKRGKVLLDVVDESNNITGQSLSYRCLQCDHAIQVLK